MQKKRFIITWNNLELSLLSNFSNNKKDFWKIVKHFTSKKDTVSSIPPLSTTNTSGTHILHVTDEEKANCLNNYFAAISTLDDSNADLPPYYELTDKVLDKIDITEDEIKYVIINLDPNKASGPDLISNKMIKQVATAISKPLKIIFNRSLNESVFPDLWKLGNLVPLFKKGDRSDASNYRPVSLLSNFGKIQERIVFKHIYNHLFSNKKVQVGKDQEKAQSEKRFPLQKPRWEKNKLTIRYLYHETYRKPNEQLFSQ